MNFVGGVGWAGTELRMPVALAVTGPVPGNRLCSVAWSGRTVLAEVLVKVLIGEVGAPAHNDSPRGGIVPPTGEECLGSILRLLKRYDGRVRMG